MRTLPRTLLLPIEVRLYLSGPNNVQVRPARHPDGSDGRWGEILATFSLEYKIIQE